MSLNKEKMVATLQELVVHPVMTTQIHAHLIAYAAPELSDVFRDHLKCREAALLQELKNIQYVRAGFEQNVKSVFAKKLKEKWKVQHD